MPNKTHKSLLLPYDQPASANNNSSSNRAIHLPRALIKTLLLLTVIGLIILSTEYGFEINWRVGDEHINEQSVAQILKHEVRVLCLIMTTPSNHKTKAIFVMRSWGKRCTRVFFVTSAADDELETLILPLEDKYELLWGKTREAFKYVWQQHRDEADWILKADDDTYLIMENLRFMLYAYSPQMPIYFGCKFKQPKNRALAYMSGGSGYVLSKEALRLFNEISLKNSSKCQFNHDDGPEDVQMGECLHNAGVLAGDSRDAEKKVRFLPFDPKAGLVASILGDFWYFNYSYYRVRNCRDCLSQYPIAFHYVKPEEMVLYEYFLYEAGVYGQKRPDQSLPAKIDSKTLIIPPSDNT